MHLYLSLRHVVLSKPIAWRLRRQLLADLSVKALVHLLQVEAEKANTQQTLKTT